MRTPVKSMPKQWEDPWQHGTHDHLAVFPSLGLEIGAFFEEMPMSANRWVSSIYYLRYFTLNLIFISLPGTSCISNKGLFLL